jgi:hypothetical protein
MSHNRPNPPDNKSAANRCCSKSFRYICSPTDKVLAIVESIRLGGVVTDRDRLTFKRLEEMRAFMVHKWSAVEFIALVFPQEQIAGELIRAGIRNALP